MQQLFILFNNLKQLVTNFISFFSFLNILPVIEAHREQYGEINISMPSISEIADNYGYISQVLFVPQQPEIIVTNEKENIMNENNQCVFKELKIKNLQ